MLLEATNLSFSYRRDGQPRAVDGVSLSVEAGSVVGVLGPNGSGKTTLIKLLSGALRAGHGDVTLDGAPLAQLPRATVARRIAVVPQDTHLAFDYTALEIVLMGRYPRLGAFEIEGPDDMPLRDGRARVHRHARLRRRGRSARSAAAKNSAWSSRRRWRSSTSASRDASTARPAVLFMDEPTASLDLALSARAGRAAAPAAIASAASRSFCRRTTFGSPPSICTTRHPAGAGPRACAEARRATC